MRFLRRLPDAAPMIMSFAYHRQAMADTNEPTERYLVTSRGFRFRIRPAENRSEVLIGPHAKALAEKRQAESAASPSERRSRSGETSTESPS